MGKSRGFTLVELMVTIAIFAVIAMMAAPSFGNMMTEQKLNASSRELVFAINQAKSQAAIMKTTVALCLNRTNTDSDFNKDECARAAIPEYTATNPGPPIVPILNNTQKAEVLKSRVISVQIDPQIVVDSGSAVAVLFNEVGSATATQTFRFCKSAHQRTIEVSRLGNVKKTSGTC
jgi:prepilin-type N-terminal cleavage/methylation domain-containing protein